MYDSYLFFNVLQERTEDRPNQVTLNHVVFQIVIFCILSVQLVVELEEMKTVEHEVGKVVQASSVATGSSKALVSNPFTWVNFDLMSRNGVISCRDKNP